MATPPAPRDAPVVFYDGGCGLCHGAVRFLLRLDRRGRLRFAPLSGDTFSALVPESTRPTLPDSLVLRDPEGRLSVRSAAALGALRLTGGVGSALASMARFVPATLADRIYDAIARARRRLFAPPVEACPRVPPRLRERFLP